MYGNLKKTKKSNFGNFLRADELMNWRKLTPHEILPLATGRLEDRKVEENEEESEEELSEGEEEGT